MPMYTTPSFDFPAPGYTFDRAVNLDIVAHVYYDISGIDAHTFYKSVNGGGYNTTGLSLIGSANLGGGQGTYTFRLAAGTVAAGDVVTFRFGHNVPESVAPGPFTTDYAYTNATGRAVPAAPTITAPTAGASITTKTPTVTWTTPLSQTGYEIEVRTATGGGGTVVYAGEGHTALSHVITLDLTGVTRYIRVRNFQYYLGDGTALWSPWQQVQITTLFTPPAVPTVVNAMSDPTTVGLSHVMTITVTHPTPSGGQPTVTTVDLEYRKAGSSDPWLPIERGLAVAGTPYKWRPPAGTWETRAIAYASSNGTSTTGTTSSSVLVTLKGVLLHDPAAVNTYPSPMLMRLNDEGAEESVEVESATVQYAGRAYPAVEFGTAGSHVLDVGTVTLRTLAEKQQLLAFLALRRVVGYRDARGRLIYGVLSLGPFRDRFYGYECALSITRVDYDNSTTEVQTI
jgi:hypothetical protein